MNEIHNNIPKTSPLPAAAGLYMYRTRSIWNIHSIALLAVYWASSRQKWAMTSISETFFLFFFIFHDRNVLSLYAVREPCCIATQDRSRVYEWTLYIPREPSANNSRELSFVIYSFFRCRRRYCSRTNNLCTRFCRNKTKISIHACWLTPFKCVFYLGGSIAVFPCREISLTTSAASIKNQFIQLRRKGNQLLGHLAS
jgi:hypothetical protein